MSRSRVDLPQPDGPMSDTNSPDPIVRSIPASAVTAVGPAPKVLPAPVIATTGRVGARLGDEAGVGSVMRLRDPGSLGVHGAVPAPGQALLRDTHDSHEGEPD